MRSRAAVTPSTTSGPAAPRRAAVARQERRVDREASPGERVEQRGRQSRRPCPPEPVKRDHARGAPRREEVALEPSPSIRCESSGWHRGCGTSTERTAGDLPLAALDCVRADLLVQVRPLDAEHDRRPRDVPARHLERVDDVLPLRLLAELAQREVTGRRPGGRARRCGGLARAPRRRSRVGVRRGSGASRPPRRRGSRAGPRAGRRW